MTYLFFLVNLYFILSVKNRLNRGWLLIPTMLVWSNVHGGFILGVGLISVFMVYETLYRIYLKNRGGSYDGYGVKMLIYGSSLCASAINPNVYSAFIIILDAIGETHYYYDMISEFLSPLFIYSRGRGDYLYIVTISSVICTIALVAGARHRADDVLLFGLLLIFFSTLSFHRIRFIPFLLLMAAPFAARYFRPYMEKMNAAIKTAGIIVLVALFTMSATSSYGKTVFFSPLLMGERFPEKTVHFMKENRIKGNLFNSYDIGGYLLWELYPDVKVFIDGRTLVMRSYDQYWAVLRGSMKPVEGAEEWKAILDQYHVEHIIIDPLDSAGYMPDLIAKLYRDPEWRLIHIGMSGVLSFSRDQTLHEYPKISALFSTLKKALKYRDAYPQNHWIHVSLAKVYLLTDQRHLAKKTLEDAISKYPSFSRGEPGRLLELLNRKT
jgi:hypothetical protein